MPWLYKVELQLNIDVIQLHRMLFKIALKPCLNLRRNVLIAIYFVRRLNWSI